MRAAKVVVSLALLALCVASRARAQHTDNHFVYTGTLFVGESPVARANELPLSRVRFVAGERVEVTVRGEGFTLEAEGTREGLWFYVHRWTLAHARGFQLLVPPDARLVVLEGSRAAAVV